MLLEEFRQEILEEHEMEQRRIQEESQRRVLPGIPVVSECPEKDLRVSSNATGRSPCCFVGRWNA